jgi:hypothetical protein
MVLYTRDMFIFHLYIFRGPVVAIQRFSFPSRINLPPPIDIYIMSDQSNHVPDSLNDRVHAHLAQVANMQSTDRGEKNGIPRPAKTASSPRSHFSFRTRNSSQNSSKSRQLEVKRPRKVRSKGIPEDEPVEGSVSSQSDGQQSSNSR